MSENGITTVAQALFKAEQEGYPVLITIANARAQDPLQARDERALRSTIQNLISTRRGEELHLVITHTEKLLPLPRTPRHSSRPDW